jgi:predicted O-methyltransferase YrrM
VLERILKTREVTDGEQTYQLHSDMPRRGGELIQRVIARVKPSVSLEIGLAYGVSTLFACETLERLGGAATHIVIDPVQTSYWRGIGLRNLREAGYQRFIEFHEGRSEIELPQLLVRGVSLDVAIIDGWHTFDQVLVDFYFVNKMLRVGGVVVFDDADWPGVNRVLRHVLTYPAYQVFDAGMSRAPAPSLRGRVRRWGAGSRAVRRWIRPDVLYANWDLGIAERCVAVQKVEPDERSLRWYEDF